MIPVRSENTVGNKGVFFIIEKWGGTNGTDNESVGGIVMKIYNLVERVNGKDNISAGGEMS